MKNTIFPDKEEYKSILGFGNRKTEYGKICSYSDGRWFHNSLNQQGNLIGEWLWNGEHHYRIRL